MIRNALLLVVGLLLWSPHAHAWYPDAGASLSTSLESDWTLDEASSTRVDGPGTNDLTDNNTVTQAAGKVGSAAQFTAANSESLSIADNASISTGDISWTLAFWLYIDSSGGDEGLISKYDNGAGANEYLVRLTTGPQVRIDVYDGGSGIGNVTATSFGNLSTATWYFVQCGHDATNNLVFVSVNGGTVDTAATSAGGADTTGTFRMGVYNAQFFNGRLDQGSFWKKRISAQEISDLYNAGAGNSYLAAQPKSPWRVWVTE